VIGALRGEIADIDASGDHAAQVLLDVNGVGYDVTVSARHAADLRAQRGTVQLAVHTHVREGAIQLFGFPDRAERRAFEMLLSAHGVGPALAMAILGVLPPDALGRALATGDLDALTAVPGVGKRTAQRLQLELAQRLDLSGSGANDDKEEASVAMAEVREALSSLGYGPEEIRHATAALPSDEPVEVLLRLALNTMAVGR
jgi:Holliday junction DNA helicase RuvA